eukprot:COSAG03_NODE_16452_length_401_cov_1.211921_1_plen_76_part_10
MTQSKYSAVTACREQPRPLRASPPGRLGLVWLAETKSEGERESKRERGSQREGERETERERGREEEGERRKTDRET